MESLGAKVEIIQEGANAVSLKIQNGTNVRRVKGIVILTLVVLEILSVERTIVETTIVMLHPMMIVVRLPTIITIMGVKLVVFPPDLDHLDPYHQELMGSEANLTKLVTCQFLILEWILQSSMIKHTKSTMLMDSLSGIQDR